LIALMIVKPCSESRKGSSGSSSDKWSRLDARLDIFYASIVCLPSFYSSSTPSPFAASTVASSAFVSASGLALSE
jgi:hypothetical protein